MSNHTSDDNSSSGAGLGCHHLGRDETKMEYISDFTLGFAFVLVGVFAAQR